MVRYLGPKCHLLRTIGVSSLPGFSSKILNWTNSGQKFRQKKTNFYYILKEKQKLRFNYGITNKKLKKYLTMCKKNVGIWSLNLLKLLEWRLDVILFRVGFCKTIPQARQLITHNFIFVNQKWITSANFLIQCNDIIHIKSNAYSIKTIIKNNLIHYFKNDSYLSHNYFQYQICIETLKIKVLRQIESKDINFKINDQLLLNIYKKL